jgi:hypothetical protein
MTVEGIIKLAMQELQVLAEGEDPSVEEEEVGLTRLNSLVASLENEDISLRFFGEAELITVSGTSVYFSEIYTSRVLYFQDPKINVVDNKTFLQRQERIRGRQMVTIDYSTIPPSIKFDIAHEVDGEVIKYGVEKHFKQFQPLEDLEYIQNANEMLILGLAYKLKNVFNAPPDLVETIYRDFREEKAKFKFTQTERSGREIVAPSFVV